MSQLNDQDPPRKRLKKEEEADLSQPSEGEDKQGVLTFEETFLFDLFIQALAPFLTIDDLHHLKDCSKSLQEKVNKVPLLENTNPYWSSQKSLKVSLNGKGKPFDQWTWCQNYLQRQNKTIKEDDERASHYACGKHEPSEMKNRNKKCWQCMKTFDRLCNGCWEHEFPLNEMASFPFFMAHRPCRDCDRKFRKKLANGDYDDY